MQQTFEHLACEQHGRSSWLILNRPDKLNAITQTLYAELRTALVVADLHEETEVVVLTGAGRAFCAGGDLAEVHGMHERNDGVELAAAVDNSTATFRQMETMAKPIVCAVNGLAHAAGFLLAMQADITIASDRATFRLAEALRGISDVYAACHLASYIGVARTKYLLMTCAEISAREACEWGLIARVVPHDRLQAAAAETVQQILDTQPGARAWNKTLVNAAALPPFDGRALKETIASGETKAGTRRFAAPAGKETPHARV